MKLFSTVAIRSNLAHPSKALIDQNLLIGRYWTSSFLSIFVVALTACSGGGGGSPTNTTPGDTTAPTAIMAPANVASSVDTAVAITANFSEDMFASTIDNINFTLSDADGDIEATVSFDAINNIAELTPSIKLDLLETYTSQLNANITDLSGNPLAITSTQFTTRDGTWNGPAYLIDGAGNGDADAPQVVVDHRGGVFAIFAKFDGVNTSIYVSRYNVDGGWIATDLIETENEGNAANPQIAVDPNGNAIAVWDQFDGVRENIWANRFTNGSWGTAEIIDGLGGSAIEPKIAVNSNGDAIAVWDQFDGTRNHIFYNRFTNGSWGGYGSIQTSFSGESSKPQVTIDLNGNANVVWFDRSSSNITSIWANRLTNGSWATAEMIETAPIDAENLQIAADPKGNVIAVWDQSDGTRTNIWANRYHFLNGWGTAELIETNDTGRAIQPQIAMSSTNNFTVVWVHNDGLHDKVGTNRFTPNGWGIAELIETVNASSNPQIAVDPNGNAIAVWHQIGGTADDCWFSRYSNNSWSTAELIETSPGNVDAPQISVGLNGHATAVWRQTNGGREAILARHFN